MSDEWFHVEVSDRAGLVVAIETEMLTGRDIGDKERATIEQAINHLKGFIGLGHVETESPYAFVRCYGDSVLGQTSCGIVGLTREQYNYQMSRPNRGWDCPNCGSTADYQDALSEAAEEKRHGR